MFQVFTVPLKSLQPSQLYICRNDLTAFQDAGQLERLDRFVPVPVYPLEGRLVLTAGHTRALAALRAGLPRIRACWEQEKLNWDAYRTCLIWCHQAGIYTIADLNDRVVDQTFYEQAWVRRWQALSEEMDAQVPIEVGAGLRNC